MRTTIDRGGRVVIPKRFRDALGLEPGRKVDIVFADDRVIIEPADAGVELVTVDGMPVLRASEELAPPAADIVRETVEEIRAERDARFV
ncbi:MAG: AbrB/MazE/SpoVT family DNA-binding domain-containing protein [Marmoricola sp.]